MSQVIYHDFAPKNAGNIRFIEMPRQCGKKLTASKAQAQKQAIEVLDAGLDLMTTLLTGDDWDVLEDVRAIRERLNAKTVAARSILIAKDLLHIMQSTIPPTQPTGGAA